MTDVGIVCLDCFERLYALESASCIIGELVEEEYFVAGRGVQNPVAVHLIDAVGSLFKLSHERIME